MTLRERVSNGVADIKQGLFHGKDNYTLTFDGELKADSEDLISKLDVIAKPYTFQSQFQQNSGAEGNSAGTFFMAGIFGGGYVVTTYLNSPLLFQLVFLIAAPATFVLGLTETEFLDDFLCYLECKGDKNNYEDEL